MGQQVSFYLTPADWDSAMKRFANCGDLVILHSRSFKPQPRIVPTIHIEENGRPWLYLYLTSRDFLNAIEMREVSAQGYWSIDVLRSPVVEVNRGYFDGRKIGEGRLYFNANFYDSFGNKIQKPEGFLKWARCILAALKKTLKYDSTKKSYIGFESILMFHSNSDVLLKSTDRIK